ncbi:hypothetical protein RB195_024028 [Necator americanus]|uniref:Uncharacterized protein n=1 Tax=Necator americanus TaxID=51031 RepID=A0ABR1ELK4_NECAM
MDELWAWHKANASQLSANAAGCCAARLTIAVASKNCETMTCLFIMSRVLPVCGRGFSGSSPIVNSYVDSLTALHVRPHAFARFEPPKRLRRHQA